MRRTWKRTLGAHLLALALALSLLPTAAWAADEPPEGAASLTQTCEAAEGTKNTLTWTITYTPGQSAGKTDFEIRATLDEELTPAF